MTLSGFKNPNKGDEFLQLNFQINIKIIELSYKPFNKVPYLEIHELSKTIRFSILLEISKLDEG